MLTSETDDIIHNMLHSASSINQTIWELLTNLL